jgi:hypothetical protein
MDRAIVQAVTTLTSKTEASFNPRPVHVEFVADEVVFLCQYVSFHQCVLCIYVSLTMFDIGNCSVVK